MGLQRERKIFRDDTFDLQIEIVIQLNSFNEYIRLAEQLINKEIKSKIHAYEKHFIEFDNCIMNYDLEYDVLIYTNKIYYNSLFIWLFSFLERTLYRMCKIPEKDNLIKIRDIYGKGIVQYYKYIKKVLQIELKDVNDEWTIIKSYNDIRNCIVHQPDQSYLKNKDNSERIKKIRSIKDLEIIENDDSIGFFINKKINEDEYFKSDLKTAANLGNKRALAVLKYVD